MSHGFNDDKSKFDLANENVSLNNFIFNYGFPIEFDASKSKIYVNANVLFFYINCTSVQFYGTSGTLFRINNKYRPAVSYCIASIRSTTAPYKEVGTIWIDTNGEVKYYLTDTSPRKFYIQGMYVLKGV